MGQRRLVPLAAIVAAMAVSWALFPTQISTLIMSLNPVEGITDVSTLDSQCSDSGLVSVVRGIKRQSVLLFRAGNSFIGAVWIPQWQTVFRSFHLMELPALIPTVKLEHVLVIGAGVGVVPHGMAARGAQVDLIEIDPVVARLALKHFGELVNSTRISLEVGDGREWVETTDHRYGLVVVDAFSGGSLPLELYSIEFMEALKPKLSENAVVAFNVLDISRWSTLGIVARRLLSTAQQAFKHVRVFTEDHDGFHNLVVLASDTRLAIRQPTATDALGDGQRNNVFRLFQDWELPVPQESSPILKDAGDELWDRTVLEGAESHWMAMRRLFKAGFWLRDLV